MTKKIAIAVVLTMALVLIVAVPALAEGYNQGDLIGDTNGDGAVDDLDAGYGASSSDIREQYMGEYQSSKGPHGDYTTTTNKCQDCHSTHYALGSYMLLRANAREDSCNFCHVGGGGSAKNIMMDNEYDAGGAGGAPSVDTASNGDDWTGYGTGHTLGYTGPAPADINPAFSDAEGFACFNCHTPHGNSARVLETFANPGRTFSGSGMVDSFTQVTVGVVAGPGNANLIIDNAAVPGADGAGTWNATGTNPINAVEPAATAAFWGIHSGDDHIVLIKAARNEDNSIKTTGGGATIWSVMNKPIWPTGQFLLLKNPDQEVDALGNSVADTVTISAGQTAGAAGLEGVNKYAIDWDDPIGPADGNYWDTFATENTWWEKGGTPTWFAPEGLSSVNEFCTDCHDGTAGQSTQAAMVYNYDADLADDGLINDSQYQLAYSHDAEPRH